MLPMPCFASAASSVWGRNTCRFRGHGSGMIARLAPIRSTSLTRTCGAHPRLPPIRSSTGAPAVRRSSSTTSTRRRPIGAPISQRYSGGWLSRTFREPPAEDRLPALAGHVEQIGLVVIRYAIEHVIAAVELDLLALV